MTSEDVQTNIRLPLALKERLVEAAAANKRSLSAEVAARLESTFQADLIVTGPDGVMMIEMKSRANVDSLAEKVAHRMVELLRDQPVDTLITRKVISPKKTTDH